MTLAFDRDGGNEVGLYALSEPRIVGDMESKNYTLINKEGLDAYFSIQENDEGKLVVAMPNGLHLTYGDGVPDSFEVVYNSGKFELVAKSGQSELARAEITIKLEMEDSSGVLREYDLPDDIKTGLASEIAIDFAGTSVVPSSVGEYALKVSYNGSSFEQIAFKTATDSNLTIGPRPLTLTKVEKVFDGQTDFEGATIDFTGEVKGESLTITGAFAAAGAGQQALTGLVINGEKSTNYVIANQNLWAQSLSRSDKC